MKIKTSELIGAALDWAAAQIEGHRVRLLGCPSYCAYIPKGKRSEYKWQPSLNWKQGGYIIEREQIAIVPMAEGWEAQFEPSADRPELHLSYGSTPLIAAMRCYVASKRGPEIEIPEEYAK